MQEYDVSSKRSYGKPVTILSTVRILSLLTFFVFSAMSCYAEHEHEEKPTEDVFVHNPIFLEGAPNYRYLAGAIGDLLRFRLGNYSSRFSLAAMASRPTPSSDSSIHDAKAHESVEVHPIGYAVAGVVSERNGLVFLTIHLSHRKDSSSTVELIKEFEEVAFDPKDMYSKVKLSARLVAKTILNILPREKLLSEKRVRFGCFREEDGKDPSGSHQFSTDLLDEILFRYDDQTTIEIEASLELKGGCKSGGNRNGPPSLYNADLLVEGRYRIRSGRVTVTPEITMFSVDASEPIRIPLQDIQKSEEKYNDLKLAVTSEISLFITSVIDQDGEWNTIHLNLTKAGDKSSSDSKFVLQTAAALVNNFQGVTVSDATEENTSVVSSSKRVKLASAAFLASQLIRRSKNEESLIKARAYYYRGMARKELLGLPVLADPSEIAEDFRLAHLLFDASKKELPLEQQKEDVISLFARADIVEQWKGKTSIADAIAIYREVLGNARITSLLLGQSDTQSLLSDEKLRLMLASSCERAAKLYISNSNFKEAQQLLDRMNSSQFRTTESMRLLAVLYFREGKYEQASQQFYKSLESCNSTKKNESCGAQETLSMSTGLESSAFSLAQHSLANKKDYEKSISALNLLEEYRKSKALYYYRGLLQADEGEQTGEHIGNRPIKLLNQAVEDLSQGITYEVSRENSWPDSYYRMSLDLTELLLIVGRTDDAYDRATLINTQLTSDSNISGKPAWFQQIAQYLLVSASIIRASDDGIGRKFLLDITNGGAQPPTVWSFQRFSEFLTRAPAIKTNNKLILQSITSKMQQLYQ